MNSEEAQKIRLLENRVEKLKIKLNSAKLIARYYSQIADNLKDDTQNFPWKLDELGESVLLRAKSETNQWRLTMLSERQRGPG